jgi:cell division transport system permease protein
MFPALKRIIKSGWLGLRRNGMFSLATIFVMVLTISLVTSFFILQGLSDFLIANLEAKFDISVYFKKNAPEEEITKIKDELLKMPEVNDVEYISCIDALNSFKERHKDDEGLLESLTELGIKEVTEEKECRESDVFLVSLNIKAREPQRYEEVSNFLKQPNFENLIYEIDYYQKETLIKDVFSITSGIKKFGIIVAIIFGVLAILVVFNTISLAILNNKEEISIMRLVGASNWFIRGPFIAQGVISSLIAILITLLIFTPVCYFSISILSFLSPKLALIFTSGFHPYKYILSDFVTLFLAQILVGIGIGVFSSLIAIRRHLQV